MRGILRIIYYFSTRLIQWLSIKNKMKKNKNVFTYSLFSQTLSSSINGPAMTDVWLCIYKPKNKIKILPTAI